MNGRKKFTRLFVSAVVCVIGLGFVAILPIWARSTVNASWTDATGNWTTASNWGCNCVPDNTSTSVFNVAIPLGDVSLDSSSTVASITINKLSLDGTLGIHNGESLSVTGNVLNNGGLDADYFIFGTSLPVVAVGGNVMNNGGIQLGFPPPSSLETPTTMTVGGKFSNTSSSALILQPFSTLQASTFTNEGTVLGFGGAITTSGNLENGTAANITLGPSARPVANGAALTVGGSLMNKGSLFVGGGTEGQANTFTVGGNLTNTASGSLTLDNVFGAPGGTVTGGVKNAGTLTVQDGTSLTTNRFNNTGTVSVSVPNIFLSNSSSLTVSQFSNSGTVAVSAGLPGPPFFAASLNVSAGGTYRQSAGSTDVDGTLMAPTVDIAGGKLFGSGTITGNVINNSIVSPGDPNAQLPNNTLAINGKYTQKPHGTLLIDISSATDFSILDVTGKASLDGTADFDFLNGYIPGANTDFAFLKAGSVTGDFTSLDIMGIKCPTCTFNLSTLSLDTGSTPPGSAVPEPGTLMLLSTGLLGLAWLLTGRQRFRG